MSDRADNREQTGGMNAATEWCSAPPTTITAARAGAFAAAIGETEPVLLNGSVLAPTIAILPAWEAEDLALARTLPAEAIAHVLHAEHAFEFLAPLQPGRAVDARSRVLAASTKRRGVLVTIRTELSDDRGLVGRQHYAAFAVGARLADTSAWSDRPRDTPAEPMGVTTKDVGAAVKDVGAAVEHVGSVVEHVDERWAERYALASGDHFEVHLDRSCAQALGYPSTILHGMCTFGIAARAVRELLGRSPRDRLAGVGVRFSAPVILPARIRTDVAIQPGSGGGQAGRFTTTDIDRGTEVLTRGFFAYARDDAHA